ncbi:protein SIEVE ELEMENT OCCLUSION C isoform X2 [Ziziphus jujuba]|uniref:Protein SIEVE ELEMENT OCCLUSION C isoform X2 n=1 Tax=Ziziphus jujuba TaxID=326968 RepID=A0ABM3I0J2_ZIZJJ|nr:protein SIEVE ELEMENT OCCLUSION C isoform X2 [Ziziphus jujuba]
MSFLGNDPFSQMPLQDFLIKKLLLSHNPDGRRLDSELLLLAVENVIFYATKTSQVPDLHLYPNAKSEIRKIEVFGSDEPLGSTINKISHQIFCESSGRDDQNQHGKTMSLFDLLGNYRWDDKAILVLAAFAIKYGEIWLRMQLCRRDNSMVVKTLPTDLNRLLMEPQFKAFSSLIKITLEVIKIVINYEGLPLSQVDLDDHGDDDGTKKTKYQICIAVYWIIRSVLAFSSGIITDLTPYVKTEYSDSRILTTWELSSLAYQLSGMYNHLRNQVEKYLQQTETKLYQKLLNIFKKTHVENQEVLRWLFAIRDDFPLLDCPTQAKFGVPQLRSKVVILLISKPDLHHHIEESLFLVQQTQDHPYNKTIQESYKIVWIPIPASNLWTDAELRSFQVLSHSLPWFSIRPPQSLSSAVVKFVKLNWNYKDDPIMVVLDPNGTVTNYNAIDMVYIWGARAYPFSSSREIDLWQEEKWTMQFLVDEIDTLLTTWVEQGRNLCIYGSKNKDWIREFNSKMKEMKETAGLELEMVYVGSRNPSNKNVKNILAMDENGKLRTTLSLTQMRFFWIRLESIRKSKLRIGNSIETDQILREVSAVLDISDSESLGWAVMGRGKSTMDILRIESMKIMECLNKFPSWGQNIVKVGFLGAIRNFLEPQTVVVDKPCEDFGVSVPYSGEVIEEMVVCEKCKHPMKKFVSYEPYDQRV